MSKSIVFALVLGVATSAHAAMFYEPFDYNAGNLGLNANSNGKQWYTSVTNGTDDRVQVTSPSLTAPAGLPVSVGNATTLGGAGRTDRIDMNLGSITTGQVYYSLLMNISDLTGTLAGGSTVFGFNNTAQTLANNDTAAQPTTITGRLVIRPLGGTSTTRYEIGIHKSLGTTGQFAFAPGDFGFSDTVFLVGRYTFNTGSATDDIFDLWVNPSSATFGDDSLIPAPSVTESAGNDGGNILTLILRQFASTVPAVMQYDELRGDTTWARVTSNQVVVPEPSALALLSVAGIALLRRRAFRNRIRSSRFV